MEYRRQVGSETWHWCINCRQWPTSDYEFRSDMPTDGDFHEECRNREKEGRCRTTHHSFRAVAAGELHQSRRDDMSAPEFVV